MADINDISTTIAAALTEVGVTGKLDVTLEGDHVVVIVGEANGDDVLVDVVVKPLR